MSTTDPQQPSTGGSPSPRYDQGQYAPPQYLPPQYAQAPLQPMPAPAIPGARVNVLGIVALALLALQTTFGAFTPLLYSLATENFAVLTTGITVVNTLILLAALGLAIGGVLRRNATRFRWTAIGSLVAAALGLVGMFLSLIGGWIASALY